MNQATNLKLRQIKERLGRHQLLVEDEVKAAEMSEAHAFRAGTSLPGRD